MSDLAATLLGFELDAEASDLVLGEDLERICIQNEADHGRLGQDEDMERENKTVWGAIRNVVELSQKRAGESTVTTLKMQVSKIEPFIKKWSPQYGRPSAGLRS